MRRLFADKNGAEYVRNMLSQETMRCNGNWSIRDPIGLAVRETSEVELLDLLEVLEIENNHTLLFESSW